MIKHPLTNIAEWRKGCSCATGHPRTCEACTEGLVKAIEGWFRERVTSAATRVLATRVVDALVRDEKDGGFDLAAGLFGPTFSALVAELALDHPPTFPEVQGVVQDLYSGAAEHALRASLETALKRQVSANPALGAAYGTTRSDQALALLASTDRDYQADSLGVWMKKSWLADILEKTGKALGTRGRAKLVDLPEAAKKLREELEQAQATINEMGDLIDSLNAAAAGLDLEP